MFVHPGSPRIKHLASKPLIVGKRGVPALLMWHAGADRSRRSKNPADWKAIIVDKGE